MEPITFTLKDAQITFGLLSGAHTAFVQRAQSSTDSITLQEEYNRTNVPDLILQYHGTKYHVLKSADLSKKDGSLHFECFVSDSTRANKFLLQIIAPEATASNNTVVKQLLQKVNASRFVMYEAVLLALKHKLNISGTKSKAKITVATEPASSSDDEDDDDLKTKALSFVRTYFGPKDAEGRGLIGDTVSPFTEHLHDDDEFDSRCNYW